MSGILNFAASGVQAAGQMSAANASAQASEFNAVQKQERAGIQATQTEADIERTTREGRARQGAARAAGGALGGLDGGILDILASNATQDQLDILNIKQQGEVAQKDLLTGARLDILEAKNTKKAGKIAAASTLLKGTAQLVGSAEKAATGGL